MQEVCATYLDRTYEEAKALLAEARDYMDTHEPIERAIMDPIDALAAVSEGLRLTTRLTEVMSWGLTQQALQAGEISRDDAAAPRRRLGSRAICLGECESDEQRLPPRLVELLRQSLSLYKRAERLDRLVAGEEMQFGSFQICLASRLSTPAREQAAEDLTQRFLLA